MPDQSRRARGRWGEDLACRHLRRLGFAIVDRNWRSGERYLSGELDVVATRNDLVVFCEVKARRSSGFGGAVAAVDDAKQLQIRRLAESWLRTADIGYERVRFDVVAIDGVHITHFEQAF